MDVTEQLKQDVREGRIDVDRLVELVASLQRQLQQAQRRIDELVKQQGGSGTVKTAEPYSLRAEEQRQEARGKKRRRKNKPLRRGRVTTAEKLKLAERIEKVFPHDVPVEDCQLSHTRPVWRLENGRAVLIAYEVYRGPQNQYGRISGTRGRSEFGTTNTDEHYLMMPDPSFVVHVCTFSVAFVVGEMVSSASPATADGDWKLGGRFGDQQRAALHRSQVLADRGRPGVASFDSADRKSVV